MKRNMDLIRQLLLGIEGETSTQHEFNIEGVDDLEKWYNVDLLVEANFIRGVAVRWAAARRQRCRLIGMVEEQPHRGPGTGSARYAGASLRSDHL